MERTDSKRRNFLRAFGLGAVAAATALLAGKRETAGTQAEKTAAQPAAVKGYHLSEHVKHYYCSARV